MDAVAGDQFVETILGGHGYGTDIYYRFFRATVIGAVIDGELWVAEDTQAAEDGQQMIVGVACWFPPGKEFSGSEEQRAAAEMDKVIEDMGEKIQRWWANYFGPKTSQQAETALGPGTKLASYHMMLLAVLPVYHNHGIGRALMYAQAERGWGEGIRVCWESGNPASVAKYQKWGGRVMSKETYESEDGTKMHDRWIMDLPKPDGTLGSAEAESDCIL